jgi:hypothetical protein
MISSVVDRRIALLFALAFTGALSLELGTDADARSSIGKLWRLLGRKRTIEEFVLEIGPSARERYIPDFKSAGAPYPPDSLTILIFKMESRVQLYARDASGTNRFIKEYRIQALTGGPGPKLRADDLQVPEGIYSLESIDANSPHYLALNIDFPNDYDRAAGRREKRHELEGNVIIAGSDSSLPSSLSMDTASLEELFVLTSDVGIANVTVVFAPTDLRYHRKPPVFSGTPTWATNLYTLIRRELNRHPLPEAGRRLTP